MTNVRTLPVDGEGHEEIAIALDELAREGARRLIAAALRAEADEYVERFSDERVEEETGERQKFSSRILPAYARRSPKVGEVIPILYLKGLSTGDFRPALE